MNLVVLKGNLTQDPECRYAGSGNAVCNMRLAVNSRRVKDGKPEEETLFMDVVVFGKTAETCKEHLAKGSPVIAQGRLRQRRWEKDGNQYSKVEVLADRIEFLGGRKDVGTGADQSDTDQFHVTEAGAAGPGDELPY